MSAEEPKEEQIVPKEEHRLHNKWKVWCKFAASKDQQASWKKSQQMVHEFQTIESFWRLFNNIQTPGSVVQPLDYSLFKSELHPSWEDEQVSLGGRWIAKIDKMKPQYIDDAWLHMILCLIGEMSGDYGQYVCGTVVSVKPKSKKLALWIGTRDPDIVMAFGQVMHEILMESNYSSDIYFEDFSQMDSEIKKSYAFTYPPKVKA